MNPTNQRTFQIVVAVTILALCLLFVELGILSSKDKIHETTASDSTGTSTTSGTSAFKVGCDLDRPPPPLPQLLPNQETEFTLKVQLSPSLELRPLRSKDAVITLFDPETAQLDAFDTHLADALLLAYSFNSRSSLSPSQKKVEVIVAHVNPLNQMQKKAFEDVGARLLSLPPISAFLPVPSLHSHSSNSSTLNSSTLNSSNLEQDEDSHKPCPNHVCWSKLFLFGLDSIFDSILYLDPSVVVSPLFNASALFDLASQDPGFFGAVPSFGLGKSFLDSSVLLFNPSTNRMNWILNSLTPNHLTDYYRDQSFLTSYFSTIPCSSSSPIPYTPLPDSYNLQHATIRPHALSKSSFIIPHSFWTTETSPLSPLAPIHTYWKSQIYSLYTYQSKHLPYTTLAPIPSSFKDLSLMVRANTFTHTFAILTIMSRDSDAKILNRTMGNRARFCKLHPEVSHVLVQDVVARNAVWQKAWSVEDLILGEESKGKKKVDWIWLLDGRDAMIMNGDAELRAIMASFILARPPILQPKTDIIIAHDKHAMNAGSFFIRNSHWTRTEFLPTWKSYANHTEEEHREHVWQEQWAIIHMHQKNITGTKDHLVEIEQERQNLINAVTMEPGMYKPGDLIVHAPGNGYSGVNWFLEYYKYKEV
ncbi:hypothetical protein BCR33DRAFT_722478 [Rhizoclosmatium globosum]|uniref:Nucleotide-diphospho-sugar transferase domain-containing protein n=1 Tax=Rhizoclosmatium globosum TaxID=329046 RepID=A0A1Y2BMM5_9FUNG|nr:hypothetical protein BCR33DRAFT_722478 [Rhizoclosmatium globosum]|eukprot:ORY36009.1 hypothetical protein BCR33DRAFT_722478 [Rhizoclosmatium globosum]